MTEPRIVRLSILDTYGVRWSIETFARDLLQNFFDAAHDFAAVSVEVDRSARTVLVRGPAEFDLDLLAFVGATTKNDGATAGGFGEGFKICALIGARDFGLAMSAGSGAESLDVFFDRVPLGRELCYRVSAAPDTQGRRGSFVRLANADDACLAAFERGKQMFRHPENEKLQRPLIDRPELGIGVYASPFRAEGELYYRRQLRGRVRYYARLGASPVTLAYDGVIDALEGDRDRRDVSAKPLAEAVGQKLPPEDLHRLLLHLMPYWEVGGDVLRPLVEAAIARKLTFSWPGGWVASHYAEQPSGPTEFAKRQGLRVALAIFQEIGMKRADQHYSNLETRPASPAQRARIDVVADLYAELVGSRATVTDYDVFDQAGAAVLGQHLGKKIIVAEPLLEGEMDNVAGTLLHELAHEAGGETSKRFLERLKLLLRETLRRPELIRETRRRYDAARPKDAAPSADAAAPTPEPEPKPKPKPKRRVPCAYTPEHEVTAIDLDGVFCLLVVPPAFPPTRTLARKIEAAAKQEGMAMCLLVRTITGDVGATKYGVRGVPAILIDDRDILANEGETVPIEEMGYRLRTYGRSQNRLGPTTKQIAAALVRAKAQGLFGRKMSIRERVRGAERAARLTLRFGIAPSAPSTDEEAARARAKRRDEAEDLVRSYSGYGDFDLHGLWSEGLHSAGMFLFDRTEDGKSPVAEIWAKTKPILTEACECARALRRADKDFDDADEMERNAMAAAQGAAVFAYVSAADPAEARAQAQACFDRIRKRTMDLLDAPVQAALKEGVLKWAIGACGIEDRFESRGKPRTFRMAAFEPAYEQGLRCALKIAEEHPHRTRKAAQYLQFEMQERLTSARRRESLARQAKSKTPEQKRAERAEREEQRRTKEETARATQEVRKTYFTKLRETGSRIEAARACIAAAARLLADKRERELAASREAEASTKEEP